MHPLQKEARVKLAPTTGARWRASSQDPNGIERTSLRVASADMSISALAKPAFLNEHLPSEGCAGFLGADMNHRRMIARVLKRCSRSTTQRDASERARAAAQKSARTLPPRRAGEESNARRSGAILTTEQTPSHPRHAVRAAAAAR